MDSTAAATKAGVTVATIRTWCRRNVITAAKVAGKWVIDSGSLAYRVALTAKKVVRFTVETMTAIGGNRWQRGDKDRVYVNDWATFIGLGVDRYKSGNISSATLDDENISNAEAGRILGAVDKVYFDAADGHVHIQWGYSTPRSFDRDDLAAAIFGGIRSAIAAL